jgi:hypothetical protein
MWCRRCRTPVTVEDDAAGACTSPGLGDLVALREALSAALVERRNAEGLTHGPGGLRQPGHWRSAGIADGLAADETVPPGPRFETFVYADRGLGLDLPRDIGR